MPRRYFDIENILVNKKTILAVVSHPDDFEDYFSGTLFYCLDKKIVDASAFHVLICTDGGKGGRDTEITSEELKAKRKKEQEESLRFMGIPENQCYFLEFEDGYIHNAGNVLTERISYYIRKLKPDIVFTHNGFEAIIEKPDGMYYVHKDHRTVGQAVMDAVYPYSRDLLFFPQHKEEGLEGHMVFNVLLAETAEPNVKVDVSPYMPKKIELIKKFMSQVESDDWLYNYFKNTTGEEGQYMECFKFVKIII